MRNIGPMLRLDLAGLTSLRTTLVVIGVLALVSVLGGPAAAASLLSMLAMFVSLLVLGRDDKGGVPMLHGALPVTRRTVVTAHYLVGGGAFAAAMLAAVLGAVASGAVSGAPWAGDVVGSLATVCGAALYVALALPAQLRYGFAGVWYTGLAVFGTLVVLSAAVSHLGVDVPSTAVSLGDRPVATSAVLLAVTGLAWLVSWLVACRVYERKDL